jgi:hypothetical protein
MPRKNEQNESKILKFKMNLGNIKPNTHIRKCRYKWKIAQVINIRGSRLASAL